MNDMLFPLCQSTARRFLGGAWVALSLMVSPTLQAYQTNFNFNASTDAGWEHWLPEDYNWGDPYFTNASHLPTVSFTTNKLSAGNMALFLHTGTTNTGILPVVGSFFTNGPSLTNFTMTTEIFGWTNGQAQNIGIIGRMQLPVPAVNPPNVESQGQSSNVVGLEMGFFNGRSAKAFQKPLHAHGSTDDLRILWSTTPAGLEPLGNQGVFNGPDVAYDGVNDNGFHTEGASYSPDPTNGHYRLILTVNSNDCTGQLVDLSTGLPMSFRPADTWWFERDHATNIVRTSFFWLFCTNNFWNTSYFEMVYDPTKNTDLTQYINVGGACGLVASASPYGGMTTPVAPYYTNYTKGQPLDPKFDDFAIVPGVVTLESAATVNGPYTQDSAAGIEVAPKRLTIPVKGNTRFYRINWIDADHTPTITGITTGPTVSVVTGGPTFGGITNQYGRPIGTVSLPVTNVVKTMVVTYN